MFNIFLIKFEIDINNKEILKTKCEHDKKKKLNFINAEQCETQMIV
jgi:hypothetical protein